MQSLCNDSTNHAHCDTTFQIGIHQRKFNVIGSLFALHSPVLSQMLKSCSHNTIAIDDITSDAFDFLRSYIYGLNPTMFRPFSLCIEYRVSVHVFLMISDPLITLNMFPHDLHTLISPTERHMANDKHSSTKSVSDILYASHKLQITPITKVVKRFILCIADTNELIGTISRLHRLQFDEFCDHIISSRRLFEDANDVFLSENLNTLPRAIMVRLLQTATIQTDKMTEEMIFEKCVIWAKWHAQIQRINHRQQRSIPDDDAEGKMEEVLDSRQSQDGGTNPSLVVVGDWKEEMKPLLEWIRFPLMSGDYFASKVVNMKILTSDDCGLVMQYLLNRRPNKNLKYSSRRRCLHFAQFKFDVFCDGNDVLQQGHCLQVLPDKTMGSGMSLMEHKAAAGPTPYQYPAPRRLYGYSKAFNSGVHTFAIQCIQVGERYIYAL